MRRKPAPNENLPLLARAPRGRRRGANAAAADAIDGDGRAVDAANAAATETRRRQTLSPQVTGAPGAGTRAVFSLMTDMVHGATRECRLYPEYEK